MERGEQVCVIDNDHLSSSSMVAAGLWNPIVFRRINKSWLADEVIPELESFYPHCERLVHAHFYHPMPIWRKHSNSLEAQLWAEKQCDSEFGPYLSPGVSDVPNKFGAFPFGQGEVQHAGWLDVPSFLGAARAFFIGRGAFRQMEIQLPDNAETIGGWAPTGEVPKRIIDCRGYKSAQSRWWRYLPFGLTKGEVLTLRCEGLQLERVFNAGFFVQPLGNDLYRVGATFNWYDKDEICTADARQFLLQKFAQHIDLPYEVVEQRAGVRPTVQDRRPLMGRHPELHTLHLFNGLGTKGVMLAPLMARHFCNWLLEDVDLPAEANLARFAHLIGQDSPQVNYP